MASEIFCSFELEQLLFTYDFVDMSLQRFPCYVVLDFLGCKLSCEAIWCKFVCSWRGFTKYKRFVLGSCQVISLSIVFTLGNI